MTLTLTEAERDLRGALRALRPGEVITLVDESGASVGELSAVDEREDRPKAKLEKGVEESFQDAWDRLAEEVSTSWRGEKSALEELQDQRNARLFEGAP